MREIKVSVSGSGFLLAAHAGAMTYLLENYDIVELAGTSGGSIISAFVACRLKQGISSADIINELKEVIFTNNDKGYSRFIKPSLWNIVRLKSYSSGKELKQFIYTITNGKTMNDVKIPLHIVSTDIISEKSAIFSNSNDYSDFNKDVHLADACRASASIPFIYPPYKCDNRQLIDGGIINNYPHQYLSKGGILVSIEINEGENKINPNTILGLLESTLSAALSAKHTTRDKIAELSNVNLIIIDLLEYTMLDYKKAWINRSELFVKGYSSAKAICENIGLLSQ